MIKKRRCAICNKWFTPSRPGDDKFAPKVCSEEHRKEYRRAYAHADHLRTYPDRREQQIARASEWNKRNRGRHQDVRKDHRRKQRMALLAIRELGLEHLLERSR